MEASMICRLAARDSQIWADPMSPLASDFFSDDMSREDRLESWFGLVSGSEVRVPLFVSVLDPASLSAVLRPGPNDDSDEDSSWSRWLVSDSASGLAWEYLVNEIGPSGEIHDAETEYFARVDPLNPDRVLCSVAGLGSSMGPVFTEESVAA